MRAIFTKPDLEEGIVEGTFYINHPYTKIELAQVLDNYGFSKVIENVYQILSNNAEEIVTKGSNWTLSKIVQINLYINRKEALHAGCPVKLPPEISKKEL